MNPYAQQIHEMMQNGTDLVMKPENLEIAKKAFPISLDEIIWIQSGDIGLIAMGYVGNKPCTTWAHVSDNRSGYAFLQPQPKPEKLSRFQRFYQETKYRIATAWRVLLTGDSDV